MKAPVIVIISIFFIAFFAASIDTYSQNFLVQHGLSGLNNDIFYKIFGEFKNYLSDIAYSKADVYYHGGIYDFDKCGEYTDEDAHLNEEAEHKHEHIHAEHEKVKGPTKPSLNILLSISEARTITEHRHLSGDEAKETIPWVHYAVKLNPHNELAYSVGGYWLAVRLKRLDEGIKFLKEGIAHNPDSWELYATLGQIYFVNKKDYKTAKIYFEKAKKLGDKQKIDKFDKKRIYIFLAESYNKIGSTDKSKKLHEELSHLFSDHE